MAIPEVDVDELEAAIAAGSLVVDVREADEYAGGHVPGAVHVPLGSVPDSVDSFRSEGITLVICRTGGRSMRACEFLGDRGVAVANVAGGTLAWVDSGRQVVAGDRPL
jgi:rhodanese-related sulfurtransferase